MKVGAWIAVAVFGLSVAVQWNDPDPWLWSLGYGVPGLFALAHALGRWDWRATALAAAVYAVLFLAGTPNLTAMRSESFTSMGMESEGDERVRETLGLLLCGGWLAWQARVEQRHSGA